MTQYRLTGEGQVDPNWIDENDHVNMMWYTHLVDTATGSLMASVGLNLGGNIGFVAARLSTAYRRELSRGQAWQTWSAILDVTDTSIVCAHRIMSGSTIAARSDLTIVLFDRLSRQSLVLPHAFKAAALAQKLGTPREGSI